MLEIGLSHKLINPAHVYIVFQLPTHEMGVEVDY